jgi:hypothetical protein
VNIEEKNNPSGDEALTLPKKHHRNIMFDCSLFLICNLLQRVRKQTPCYYLILDRHYKRTILCYHLVSNPMESLVVLPRLVYMKYLPILYKSIYFVFICLILVHSKIMSQDSRESHELVDIESRVTFDNKLKSDSISNILRKASREALKGGISGAAGGAIQVITMMWLRTTVNYQCRYGGSIMEAMHALYGQGGVARFYQGISYAIIQGPLSRFGSVAANEGAREFMKLQLPLGSQTSYLLTATALGGILASIWRAILMPIDTCKTVLQVEGREGFARLMSRVLKGEIFLLYEGTIATMLGAVVSHYPWFVCHNWLDGTISKPKAFRMRLLRDAFIGFLSTAVSDTVSNIVRVVKTVKQASASLGIMDVSYRSIVLQLYQEGGLSALFGRGLLLRIISNGIQGMLFVVVWKYIAEYLKKNSPREEENEPKSK